MRSTLVENIYCQHHSWLSSWLQQRTGCDQTAADLAQDTFVRLLKKPNIAEQHNSRAYLKKIADGLWIDLWRRHQIEKAWQDTLSQYPDALAPSAEEHLIILETLYEVDALLSNLPKKVATAFILSQVNGLTYREIALQLEVSERMVKKYMAQAMLHCALIEADLNDAAC